MTTKNYNYWTGVVAEQVALTSHVEQEGVFVIGQHNARRRALVDEKRHYYDLIRKRVSLCPRSFEDLGLLEINTQLSPRDQAVCLRSAIGAIEKFGLLTQRFRISFVIREELSKDCLINSLPYNQIKQAKRKGEPQKWNLDMLYPGVDIPPYSEEVISALLHSKWQTLPNWKQKVEGPHPCNYVENKDNDLAYAKFQLATEVMSLATIKNTLVLLPEFEKKRVAKEIHHYLLS
ncbi:MULTISPECIES: hypothetical protein [Vibrio]|uniref:hypothetical protein n=1 Tax=Vibrio TaxID=662 RepID=UPI000841FAE1|nr:MULTISPECIES: hypothetical protein [Vibrio]ODM56997.1 hypothetical protein BC455_18055 [Vibrio harveyi]USD58661.1 hypothetical protein J4N44_27295 [Vibrio sp. SCSIO 43155]